MTDNPINNTVLCRLGLHLWGKWKYNGSVSGFPTREKHCVFCKDIKAQLYARGGIE